MESIRLSETDLLFLLDAIGAESEQRGKLKELVRKDEALLNSIIGDEKVFSKVIGDEESFLRISPQLYFEVLLRKAHHQFKDAGYTVERSGRETVPVFDMKEVNDLLSRNSVLTYLADMLASFTKIKNYSISYPVRKGIWRTIRYSDLDIDSLKKYGEWVDEQQRLDVYKRIGDVCLFIVGIFPEYAQFSQRYPFSGEPRPKFPGQIGRNMEEYEKEGKKFYESAAGHPAARSTGLSEVFGLLHEYFNTAKKPLNFISEHYLHYRRSYLFGVEAY